MILEVYDKYALFLQSGEISVHKVKAFPSYFGLNTLLFTFSEHEFSTVKLLNPENQNAP